MPPSISSGIYLAGIAQHGVTRSTKIVLLK
jgi:hypothetical protein